MSKREPWPRGALPARCFPPPLCVRAIPGAPRGPSWRGVQGTPSTLPRAPLNDRLCICVPRPWALTAGVLWQFSTGVQGQGGLSVATGTILVSAGSDQTLSWDRGPRSHGLSHSSGAARSTCLGLGSHRDTRAPRSPLTWEGVQDRSARSLCRGRVACSHPARP